MNQFETEATSDSNWSKLLYKDHFGTEVINQSTTSDSKCSKLQEKARPL